MTLEEGYARIRLKKGAEVILQAPSTFDLRTTNRMFLESGWVTALVPPSATGFAVRTPASSATDFGTEFGLLVGEGSRTEVHVFDGRIELDLASPFYSETWREFSPVQNWTVHGVSDLVLSFRGYPVSFQESAGSTITMSAWGNDIYGTADQCRFAYKPLTGNGASRLYIDDIHVAQ